MANEITVTAALAVSNGNYVSSWAPGVKTYDQTAAGGPWPGVVEIGTSEESIDPDSGTTTSIATEGWCMMQNLSASNYVSLGFSTGVYGIRMEAGETAGPFRLEPGAVLYLLANTAACDVRIEIYED